MKLFLILILTLILITIVGNVLLIHENLYFNYFQDKVTAAELDKLLARVNKWDWVTYPLIPITYGIKLSCITLCISTGLFFSNYKVPLGQVFNAVTRSEFFLVIPSLIKIVWFYWFQATYTLEDLQTFFPCSVLNFIDHRSLENWLIYPLSLINLFELGYILMLTSFIASTINRTFSQSLKIILSTYGTALLLWVVFISFISISLQTRNI